MRLSREELVELAGRDALGILDPDEKEAFDAAFRRADAALRAELRAVQESATSLIDALPAPLPKVELRARVLARLDECIEQMPPPALKGRVLRSVEDLVTRDLHGSLQFADVREPSRPGRHDWIERVAAGRVSPMWRIAALVLLTISLGLAWLALDAYSNAMRLADRVATNRIEEILRIQFKQLPEDYWFNPESRLTTFDVVASDFKGRAMLAVLNSQDRGFLVAINMPASPDPYRLLVGLNDDPTEARTVVEFYSKDGTSAVPISLGSLNVTSATWWIMGPSASGEGTETALLQITP